MLKDICSSVYGPSCYFHILSPLPGVHNKLFDSLWWKSYLPLRDKERLWYSWQFDAQIFMDYDLISGMNWFISILLFCTNQTMPVSTEYCITVTSSRPTHFSGEGEFFCSRLLYLQIFNSSLLEFFFFLYIIKGEFYISLLPTLS